MTTSDAKRITYNRESRDYDATFDGQYIGSFPKRHQAEVALDDYALDLIEQGLVDDMQILARPAEPVEVVYTPLALTCEHCLTAKPESGFTTVLTDPNEDLVICDACLDTLPIELLQALRQVNARAKYEASLSNDDHPELDPEYLAFLQDLPAAPPAVENTVHTSDSFSGLEVSTAAGREDAAPMLMPEGDWLDTDGMRVAPPLASTASPDPATAPVAPAYCLHLDACEEHSCPACTDPAGPYRCPLCQTNAHYATQCPDVALTKYGMGVWEAYMEDRVAFLRLIQWAAAARLLLMGNAVAHYLNARWGHSITGRQVLVAWMQNAAPAS